MAVYRLTGPVNRRPRAANRSGPVDLLPVRLAGGGDRLAELRGRLAGDGRRTAISGGGQESMRGERMREARLRLLVLRREVKCTLPRDGP